MGVCPWDLFTWRQYTAANDTVHLSCTSEPNADDCRRQQHTLIRVSDKLSFNNAQNNIRSEAIRFVP